MNTYKAILGIIRAPFLILVPACLAPVYVVYFQTVPVIEWLWVILTFIAALLSHIAVNVLNEYQDFNSGLDIQTNKTPFSGGSGVLPKFPQYKLLALYIFILSIIGLIGLGIIFIYFRSFHIIWFGLIGLIIILTYTQWLNLHPWLCLFSPGIGFGFSIIAGSSFALLNDIPVSIIFIGLIMTLLVSNLLLLNQLPDINADKNVGRYHLPIAYGAEVVSKVSFTLLILIYIILLFGVVLGHLPISVLLCLLTVPLFVGIKRKLATFDLRNLSHFISALVMSVMLTIIFPCLYALGIYINV